LLEGEIVRRPNRELFFNSRGTFITVIFVIVARAIDKLGFYKKSLKLKNNKSSQKK